MFRFALSPLFVIILTPFIRPFRLRRHVLTYLFPMIPALIFWDGLISVLRTYTGNEMLKMANEADPGQLYQWKAEVLDCGQIKMPYLAGWPLKSPELS